MVFRMKSNMPHKVLVTVGGTGGHIFPAQALAVQLQKVDPSISIMFVGAGLASNRFFDREWPFQEIASANLAFKGPIHLMRNCRDWIKGILQGRKILKSFQPQVVVGFGSYHTFPLLVAAKWADVPIVLHEANSYPGKVNRFFAPYAQAVGIHFPGTAKWMKGPTLEVGLPLREGYYTERCTTQEARRYFNLDPHRLTFLVFGGSQGALGINHLFSQAIIDHWAGKVKQFQVIHFTGDPLLADRLQRLYEEYKVEACVKAFETNMELAWQAADLMISRAGAVTLAEQMEMEVPGILIPYPFAADNHQDFNADFMVEVGGAIKKAEAGLTSALLARTIEELVGQGQDRLKIMQERMRQYKKTVSRRDLCSLVCEVGGIKIS